MRTSQRVAQVEPPGAPETMTSPDGPIEASGPAGHGSTRSVQRRDIQALRGFAVLVVVLFHAKLGIFRAGYLGVDVFFVISGFLITRLVADGIAAGTFSFREFYFRRAKRLLPAAYVTFGVTALIAPLMLTSVEMNEFKAQLVGAVTFTSNFVLWRQSSYFGGAAELKPLLHAWSLSLEEQYYFLLPLTMWLLPKRLWKPATLIVILSSLTLCLVYVNRSTATFYLLPTRAWELSMGSLGALVPLEGRFLAAARRVTPLAVLTLVVVAFAPLSPYHPGPEAVAICVATLLVILARHPWFELSVATRPWAKLGDISYSLYLVHWPLFAFLSNAFIARLGAESPPLAWRLATLAVSLVASVLLSKYVEIPIHRAKLKATAAWMARGVIATIAVLGVGWISGSLASAGDRYAFLRRANHGIGADCSALPYAPATDCRNAAAPRVLVWGDSFAMHVMPAIVGPGADALPVAQATRGECGPLLGVAPVERRFGTGANRAWAERCIEFNNSVLSYLRQTPSIETVVLSSVLAGYVDAAGHNVLERGADGKLVIGTAGPQPAVRGLEETVEQVRALGRKVVIIAPPPSAGFDSSRCLERLERHLPTISAPANCNFDFQDYRARSLPVRSVLDEVSATEHVELVSFDRYLCDARECRAKIDGNFVYMDGGHLSNEGAASLGRQMALPHTITAPPRSTP